VVFGVEAYLLLVIFFFLSFSFVYSSFVLSGFVPAVFTRKRSSLLGGAEAWHIVLFSLNYRRKREGLAINIIVIRFYKIK
jgi:hypothetical protein